MLLKTFYCAFIYPTSKLHAAFALGLIDWSFIVGVIMAQPSNKNPVFPKKKKWTACFITPVNAFHAAFTQIPKAQVSMSWSESVMYWFYFSDYTTPLFLFKPSGCRTIGFSGVSRWFRPLHPNMKEKLPYIGNLLFSTLQFKGLKSPAILIFGNTLCAAPVIMHYKHTYYLKYCAYGNVESFKHS